VGSILYITAGYITAGCEREKGMKKGQNLAHPVELSESDSN